MTDAICKYCQRPMRVTAEALRENPYCSACLHERLAKGAAANPVYGWDSQGEHMIPIRELPRFKTRPWPLARLSLNVEIQA